MLWWSRKRVEGILAASLYEPLSERDQMTLQRAIDSDPALRAEYEALRGLVGAIPVEPLLNTPDLLPLLNKKLDATPRRTVSYRFAYACAATLLIAGASFGVWSATRPVPSGMPTAVHKSDALNTLMAQALAEADALVARHDQVGAYEALRKALARQPGDAEAGEAQWRVAAMAFEMKRYPDALAAYGELLDRYRGFIESDKGRIAEAIARRDLLTEAKRVEFRSLQDYDAALRDRTNTFAKLEEVVVGYQQQYAVADLAVKEMAAIVAHENGVIETSPAGSLAALKAARDRCKAPVAVALLDLKMGDVYTKDLKDYPSAAAQYQRAAENPALASRANEALDRLAKLQR